MPMRCLANFYLSFYIVPHLLLLRSSVKISLLSSHIRLSPSLDTTYSPTAPFYCLYLPALAQVRVLRPDGK